MPLLNKNVSIVIVFVAQLGYSQQDTNLDSDEEDIKHAEDKKGRSSTTPKSSFDTSQDYVSSNVSSQHGAVNLHDTSYESPCNVSFGKKEEQAIKRAKSQECVLTKLVVAPSEIIDLQHQIYSRTFQDEHSFEKSFEGHKNNSDYNTEVQVPRSLSHDSEESPILAGLTSTPKKDIPCETINTCQTLPAKVGVTNK